MKILEKHWRKLVPDATSRTWKSAVGRKAVIKLLEDAGLLKGQKKK